MPAEKHIALVVNPTESKALRVADDVAVSLTARGISFTVFSTTWPHSYESFTDVWIIGGDGTLNHFINRNPDIITPLSIFRGGSGNDFHWMLYGDLKTEGQIDRVLQSEPRAVDAGICNGVLFLNGLGIGFDGAIVKDLQGKKKVAGKASYHVSILKNIVAYTEKHCEIYWNNRYLAQECFIVSVANAQRYGGGFYIAPRASLTDGLLDVNIVGKIPPLKRIQYLPVIERGSHLDLPFVTYDHTKEFTLSAGVSLPAHLDGEYLFTDKFTVSVLPDRFLFRW